MWQHMATPPHTHTMVLVPVSEGGRASKEDEACTVQGTEPAQSNGSCAAEHGRPESLWSLEVTSCTMVPRGMAPLFSLRGRHSTLMDCSFKASPKMAEPWAAMCASGARYAVRRVLFVPAPGH